MSDIEKIMQEFQAERAGFLPPSGGIKKQEVPAVRIAERKKYTVDPAYIVYCGEMMMDICLISLYEKFRYSRVRGGRVSANAFHYVDEAIKKHGRHLHKCNMYLQEKLSKESEAIYARREGHGKALLLGEAQDIYMIAFLLSLRQKEHFSLKKLEEFRNAVQENIRYMNKRCVKTHSIGANGAAEALKKFGMELPPLETEDKSTTLFHTILEPKMLEYGYTQPFIERIKENVTFRVCV